MSVTTVTKRYRPQLVTRSAGRYRVTTPYRGVTLVTPPKPKTNKDKEATIWASVMVPMPPSGSWEGVAVRAVLLSLPKIQRKNR